jgi:peptide/nickel transport system substrate-binding protein
VSNQRIQTTLLLGLVTAGGCGCDEARATHRNDQLVIGMGQVPDSLWPGMASMMAGSEFKTHLGINPATAMTVIEPTEKGWVVTPNLAGYLPAPGAQRVVPSLDNGGMEDLCKAHPAVDAEARCGRSMADMDGKQVQAVMKTTWDLRPDAKWSDGKRVTVDDVVFGYRFMMSADLPIIDRSMEQKIARIGAVVDAAGKASATRFEIYWKELYAYSETGSLTILPKHLLHDAFIANPGRLKEHAYGRKPIGWGPWVIDEYQRDSHIILKPNKYFWGYDKMKLKKLTYRFIRNTNSLKAALEAGDIDATSETGLNLDDVVKLEKRYAKRFPDRWNYYYRSGLVWEHIDLRVDEDEKVHKGVPNPLLDVRVRRALVHAANRQLIADALFEGKVKVAHSYLPDMHYAYHESIRQYEYDPKKAGALLDAAGWKMGADGIREKDGRKLRVEFGTTAENKLRELVQQVLQQDWKRVGIDVESRNEPPQAFFGQTTHKRKFKHMAMYAWLLSPVAAGDTLFRGDQVPSKENNWQGQNYAGLQNDEMTKLAILGEKQIDRRERTKTIRRVQEIYADQLPAIPLYFRVNTSVTTGRLKNWRPTGTSIPISWNSHEWALED